MTTINNYPVENSINRLLFWAATNPLVKNPDGTVTLYIQRMRPGQGQGIKLATSPSFGRWYIILRAYPPEQRTIESAYNTDVYSPGPALKVN